MGEQLTYISLFSSAGVGCFGFKEEGFQCVATNELIPRRLDVQRFNNKCKYESGYICGDITAPSTKKMIYTEIDRWKSSEGLKGLDVLIATPPCQGMSVANHKKTSTEIVRNSLVIESIKLIAEIRPRVFIFENVPAFMKTICTDTDGVDKPIADAIQKSLGELYSYATRVINFKDYGACSSRSRTLVIGVRHDYADEVSPYELFPNRQAEKTLRQVIGHLPALQEMGEISPNDIYHAFRSYPENMRIWIHDLCEGESAFDNADPKKRPHQVKNGEVVENIRKNGDKYRRQFWDKTGPCVHTRNDQLASQNTIHPADDRVFSIRELMLMMTIPRSFKWSNMDLESLNALSIQKKQAYLKKEEIKIRQSLGEAVPTEIFRSIAKNYKFCFSQRFATARDLKEVLESGAFKNTKDCLAYICENAPGWSLSSLMRMAELANTKRTETAAYYTNKSIITEIIKRLPDKTTDSIRILEPSVGIGGFIPLLIKRFDSRAMVIDVVDIDEISLEFLKVFLGKICVPENVTINFVNDDFLTHDFQERYDYVVGNPPFGRITENGARLKEYRKGAKNKDTTNICSFFLDKCLDVADTVSLVLPKAVLNTPEFEATRDYLFATHIDAILDFGEIGFKGVLVETIAIIIQTAGKPGVTEIFSMTDNSSIMQKQSYYTDKAYPYWIIYRNNHFDAVAKKLVFGCFDVFRDRQITNSVLSKSGEIPVLKSRNINDTGDAIISVKGYDAFICEEAARGLAVYRFLESDDVYLTPNMTYKPRVMKKPQGVLVNGSVAILIPRGGIVPTVEQLQYFSSEEFRQFYRDARNHQTRSLNVDACSVFFFGLNREGEISNAMVDRS
jgi:DNA (cytosine-5)-methyltransferase 1